MAVYLFAAIVCGSAWARNKRWCSNSLLAPCLTMLDAILFLDAAFNWRWILHGILVNAAVANGVYGQREIPQVLALLGLAGLASYGMAIAWRHLRGRDDAILAVFGGVASAACWLVEVISLDATDVALHTRIRPVMVIAAVWVLTSATTVAGVHWDVRMPRSNFESGT